MVDGYFGGGLAEAERAAAARRQKERQADLQDGDPEARNDMAMQTSRQAEADARLFAGQLLAARRSGNQEIYERTERTVAPMLARQVAVAIAGRKRVPFDRAMGEAEPMTRAIVDGIRRMPDMEADATLAGRGASQAELDRTRMAEAMAATPERSVEPYGSRASVAVGSAVPMAGGKIDPGQLRVGRVYALGGEQWRWTGHDFEAVL